MNWWWVRLSGPTRELELLHSLFTADTARVLEEEGRYYLSADAFERLGNVDDVRKVALRLLDAMLGMATLAGRIGPV